MSSSLHLHPGKHGGADLCDGCLAVVIDDSAVQFYEGSFRGDQDEPTLRHSREGEDLVTLEPIRSWQDHLPGLSNMEEASKAGCQLCGFVRHAILRKQLKFESPISVNASYVWGKERDLLQSRDDGLILWRCEVYSEEHGQILALDFSVETSNRDMIFWLRMDDKRAPDPLHPDNVEWIQSELERCEQECDHARAYSQFLPTRLVDVGNDQGDNPRVVITKDLLMGESSDKPHGISYATLSYCWGPEQEGLEQVKTTHANLSQHCNSMMIDDLSAVVRDTITVCRALSIRYIWVDALCILQDDREDWDKESQMMGQVYYCSSLTICSLLSSSCLQGYLAPRSPGLDIDFQSSRRKSICGTYTLYQHPDDPVKGGIWPKSSHMLDMRQSSWANRGWTFQEEILSLRTLYFGSSMCHFACESESMSENAFLSEGSSHCGPRYFMNAALESDTSQDNVLAIDKKMEPYQHWGAMREVQKRKWTYQDDLLPGISGLAKECATMTNDTYLAGLWKADLHYTLSWEVTNPDLGDLDQILHRLRSQNPYVAPSWSWASSQGKWTEDLTDRRYPIDTEQEPAQKNLRFVNSFGLPCHVSQEFTVKEVQMELCGQNPYGRLKSGSMQISGKVRPFPSDVVMKPPTNDRPSFGYFSNGYGTCQLDWAVESTAIQDPRRMLLLLVSSCCSATSNWERLKWYANPDEDHAKSLRTFMDEHGVCVFGQSDYKSSEDCGHCKDPKQARNAWGIVLHPTAEVGSYYRVGAFALFAYRGGTALFNHVENQDMKLL